MLRRALIVVVAAPVALLAASQAGAQIRASERASVSQTVDGSVITVDYSRPQVRKREELFGKVVHPGESWTPGANSATTLELSRDVRLNGHDVPAGKYSLWLTTNPGAWVLYLNRNAALFHTQHPKTSDMFLSIPVDATAGEHVEVLTFDFPRVAPDSTTLRFRWGPMSFGVEIVVAPSRPTTRLTDPQAAPYLGRYGLVFISGTGTSPERKLEIVNARGVLRAIVDGPEPFVMELIPTSEPHRFMPAFLDGGQVFDVEVTPVIFEMTEGRAAGFYSPGVTTPAWMRATRRK